MKGHRVSPQRAAFPRGGVWNWALHFLLENLEDGNRIFVRTVYLPSFAGVSFFLYLCPPVIFPAYLNDENSCYR